MSGNEPFSKQPTQRVSTLELYFDLVFVFIITQVTHMVEHAHGVLDLMKGTLVLGITWWMYGGYAWLTNHVSTNMVLHRILLLIGMAGFLMIGISVPKAFDEGGLLFGGGFLLVTLVHTVLFTQADRTASVLASLRIAPYHLVSAILAVCAGFSRGQLDWILLGGSFAIQFMSPLLSQTRGFMVQPNHFVERHGLVMIIALGEAVVAIGNNATGKALEVPLIAKALMGLALTSALWWTYFDHETDEAEEAMHNASPHRRSQMAISGYGYAHLGMIFGIVLLASSIQGFMVRHEENDGFPSLWLLASGLSIYLLSDVVFRWWMGIQAKTLRMVFAASMLPLAWIMRSFSDLTQLATFTALMLVLLVLEHRMRPPKPDRETAKQAPE